MANNPLDTNEFSFWLRFNSLSQTNWYQISEPIGFDGAKFVIEQESQRFARSVKYGAIDKLKFLNEKGEKTSTTQVVNPQGDISDYLDYGFEWLSHTYSIYGFESDVDLLIRIGNIDFQIYGLNFKDKDITDRYTYFQCNLIDNSKVADYKRRMNDTLNAFSDKGVFQQTVVPIQTFNYLRRATPINQVSKWRSNGNQTSAIAWKYITNPTGGMFPTIGNVNAGCNNSNVSEEYEIEDTLGFISNNYATVVGYDNATMVPNDSLNFTYLEAKNTLTNVTIDITNISASSSATFFPSSNVLSAVGTAKLLVIVGNDLELEPFDVYTVWNRNFNKPTSPLDPINNSPQSVPNSFSLNIPYIERDKRVYIYFACKLNVNYADNTINTPAQIIRVILNSLDIKITATSTALDTVVKAVRYVDLIKQGNKMLHNLPFNAPKFDVNGQFYDQAVFNKRMISQNIDFLYFKNKDIHESTEEFCGDVEISENEFYVAQYEDYYTNDEIGVFSIIPDESTNIDINDRFACNKYSFSYSKYAQDRAINGTSKAVHTESEWKLQNLKVENEKDIKNDFIRDPFAIQDIVNLEISKPTTSTDSDNSICIEDMIQLAPNSFGIINAILYLRIANGLLEVLNRSLNNTADNVVINWITQGIGVGMNIQILNGANAGSYTVSAVTTSVLTLSPNFTMSPLPEGNWFISIKHYYTNVLWQTRTNQGFSLIDGVSSQFGNLRYTIKRNILNYWLKYLSTMLMYSKKDIINSFFKSNGALKTQLTTETVPVIENATILYSDLPTPILTGNIINLTVYADYNDVLNYMNLYKTKKGFVRCLDLLGNVIKGYVQKSEFLLSENKFTLTLEEKFELQTLTLIYSNGILTVNDVTYNLSGISNWWKTQNDYIQFFDNKNKPICNLYRYNFINLNGVTYSSINDLVIALNSLP